MITDNQKKRLENAGYTVSKSGTTVLTKDGSSIGGINSNGKVWSGSDTVTKILKGSGEKSTSTKSNTSKKPSERRAAASGSSKAPTQSKRPKERQKGRGEPNYGKPEKQSSMGGPRRGSNKPTERKEDMPSMPRAYTPEEAKTILLRSKSVSYDQWDSMSKQERRDKGLPTTTAGWQNREFLDNPIAWAKKQLGIRDKETSGGSSGRRTTGNREYNKGGMVKSGNKDYKKSGMFYKSGSPRGYK